MKRVIRILLIVLLMLALLLFVYKAFHVEEKILTYFYPIKYEEYVWEYSSKLNIDPLLTLAIIKTESNFKENTISKSGAIGLMQLMESTAKEQAEKIGIEYSTELLYNPENNIKLGLYYFDTLLTYYNDNYILAFAAYNAGLGNVEKWINDGLITKEGEGTENIPFPETNMYVRKIIRNYKIYQNLYKEEL